MIHLHSLDTKEFRRRRPRLLKGLHHRSLGTKEFRRDHPLLFKEPHRQETPWPRCRPHGVTTAYLWSDFALGRHRITYKAECLACIVLIY